MVQTTVQLVCSYCGTEFYRPLWKVRQAEQKGAKPYCGYVCSRAARRIRTPESKAEYHRAYREKNRDLLSEKQKAARHGERREHILARDKAIYRRNIENNRKIAREYAREHREEAIARRKAWAKENPERRDFHMARSILAQSAGMLPSEIPDDLAEAKAEHLKILRWVKEQRAAQGTEAQRAETGMGSVHDGPVGNADAPNSEGTQRHAQ